MLIHSMSMHKGKLKSKFARLVGTSILCRPYFYNVFETEVYWSVFLRRLFQAISIHSSFAYILKC